MSQDDNEKVRPTLKSNESNSLLPKKVSLGPPPEEQQVLFHVEKQIEYDGVEMGVLENGIPYLTESGLARMCGIDRKVLNRLAINWPEEKHKGRGSQIADLLAQAGYTENSLYLKSENKGVEINAYTEPVCLALLEYYAFLADERRPEALNAFRILARTSFRAYVYRFVGYAPTQTTLDSWQHFHDRLDMTLDAVPDGYFSVFREIASMIVPMIRSGVMISDKVVPDISVGRTWSDYWVANNLSKTFGERIKYDHEYPEYYPQAKSNPQPCYAYPEEALKVFRSWLRNNYIVAKFPQYLFNQVKADKLSKGTVAKALEAFKPKAIEAAKSVE